MHHSSSVTNSHARLSRSNSCQKYSPTDVIIIAFTDEKTFTPTTLKNPQNDRLYSYPRQRNRRSHFARAVHSHHPLPVAMKWSLLLHELFAASALQCIVMAEEKPPKLLLPVGGSAPHVTHGSLGPPKSSSKTACRSVQPFSGDRL